MKQVYTYIFFCLYTNKQGYVFHFYITRAQEMAKLWIIKHVPTDI